MEFVNLTPHNVNIQKMDGTWVIFPSRGCARVVTKFCNKAEFEGFRIVTTSYEHVEGLPPSREDVCYIVSTIVANIAKQLGRKDVVTPADFVRDESGNVIGCKAFSL